MQSTLAAIGILVAYVVSLSSHSALTPSQNVPRSSRSVSVPKLILRQTQERCELQFDDRNWKATDSESLRAGDCLFFLLKDTTNNNQYVMKVCKSTLTSFTDELKVNRIITQYFKNNPTSKFRKYFLEIYCDELGDDFVSAKTIKDRFGVSIDDGNEENKQYSWIITKMYDKTASKTMKDFISTNKGYSRFCFETICPTIYGYFMALAEAINFFNTELGIAHNDIRHGNNIGIIGDDLSVPKITDFGDTYKKGITKYRDRTHFWKHLVDVVGTLSPEDSMRTQEIARHYGSDGPRISIKAIEDIMQFVFPKYERLPYIDKIGAVPLHGDRDWIKDHLHHMTKLSLLTKRQTEYNVHRPEICIHIDTNTCNVYAMESGYSFFHFLVLTIKVVDIDIKQVVDKLNIDINQYNVTILRNFEISGLYKRIDIGLPNNYRYMKLAQFSRCGWGGFFQSRNYTDNMQFDRVLTICLCDDFTVVYKHDWGGNDENKILSHLSKTAFANWINSLNPDTHFTPTQLHQVNKHHTRQLKILETKIIDMEYENNSLWKAIGVNTAKTNEVHIKFWGFSKPLRDILMISLYERINQARDRDRIKFEAHFDNTFEWEPGYR